MFDSLRPHGLQNARLPCPSPTPRAYSNSCPSRWWCHPTISSFPSIRAFPNELVLHIKWPKYWSFSFSISPSDEYSGLTSFRIDWLAREFQKNIYFCFIDYTKAFDCVDHNKLCKFPKEMGIPDHLTCLLRNLYAWTWNNRLVPNRERSTLRVYIVTLLI